LGREQAHTLLQDTIIALGLQQDPVAAYRLSGLTQLTPGDFAAVLRQARITNVGSAATVVELLTQECAMKEGGARRPVGFQGSRAHETEVRINE